MKSRSLWLGLLASALVMGISPLTPVMRAQSRTTQMGQSQAPSQNKTQMFFGEILKANNGKYALVTDAQKGTGYYLDDSGKAGKFEGKNVKVRGTLDVATNTIHVTDIEPV